MRGQTPCRGSKRDWGGIDPLLGRASGSLHLSPSSCIKITYQHARSWKNHVNRLKTQWAVSILGAKKVFFSWKNEKKRADPPSPPPEGTNPLLACAVLARLSWKWEGITMGWIHVRTPSLEVIGNRLGPNRRGSLLLKGVFQVVFGVQKSFFFWLVRADYSALLIQWAYYQFSHCIKVSGKTKHM